MIEHLHKLEKFELILKSDQNDVLKIYSQKTKIDLVSMFYILYTIDLMINNI